MASRTARLASNRWLRWRRRGRMVWWLCRPGGAEGEWAWAGASAPPSSGVSGRSRVGSTGHRSKSRVMGHLGSHTGSTRGPPFERADHAASAMNSSARRGPGWPEDRTGRRQPPRRCAWTRWSASETGTPVRRSVRTEWNQCAPAGGRGCSPGLLGGSPRFMGHTSLAVCPRAHQASPHRLHTARLEAASPTDGGRPHAHGSASDRCGHTGAVPVATRTVQVATPTMGMPGLMPRLEPPKAASPALKIPPSAPTSQ